MIRIEKIPHKFPPINKDLPILRRAKRFYIPNENTKGISLDERINLLTQELKKNNEQRT
jgi:hypothetical protein